MKRKIFRSTMLVALAVLLASLAIVTSFLYNYFGGIQEQQMQDELGLAIAGVESSGRAYLQTLDCGEYRLTWITKDGQVLFDTQADADAMENHADRQEIRDALERGEGKDSRYSSTMMEKRLYYARRLPDDTVLRISVRRAAAWVLLLGMMQPVVVVLVLAVVLSALLARRQARRIMEPLNQLDLDRPLENDAYEELAPLLERIYRQHRQIDAQVQELKRRKEDFQQITASMKEGLILLNEEGRVISINPAAQTIFRVDDACIGKDFLTIERGCDVNRAMEQGFREGHGEVRCERNGTAYQFDFSRIESDGETVGAVLLVFDVTEQARLEQVRREFTANVSHELKTPLQTIMGSAELLENGLAKAEDVPRFVAHIRTESARLMALIDDILQLSRMDAGVPLPEEPVDLQDIAGEAVEAVRTAAEAKGVTIQLQGESAPMQGISRLLFELVYNLCDNGVKYNVEGGTVTVVVRPEGGKVRLQVQDTGIGIPSEHLPRIFERFYRVDQSHSRASGGTGLGLSIVKHAAACHHAQVDLQSTVGKGTMVTVVFPGQKADAAAIQ